MWILYNIDDQSVDDNGRSLERGREAFGRKAWDDAYADLSTADRACPLIRVKPKDLAAAGFAWIDLPVFDETGEPMHQRGLVAQEPGLSFVGLHFLYAMSSTMIHGVGNALRIPADAIAAYSPGAVEGCGGLYSVVPSLAGP